MSSMSNFKKAVIFGLLGWGTLAGFSVAEYSKILAKSCYFGQSWLFCSENLNSPLKAILILSFAFSIICLVCSGIFIWKSFKAKEEISTKKTIVTVILFLFLALLVVPFSSGDIVYYFYAGKAEQHTDLNLFTQDWYRDNYFVNPPVKYFNERFPYGPLMARTFGAVYQLSQDNVLAFIVLWKITVMILFLFGGWLVYKYLKSMGCDFSRNGFWLLWCLQPLMLFEGLSTGHQDILWLVFVILAILFAQKKKWWLVLPALTVGIWIKIIPAFFIPFFIVKWWQDVHKDNWTKLVGQQIIGVALSVLITILSWGHFWNGLGVFTTLGKMSKTAGGSTFAAIYYSLKPLFQFLIGANFHWYLTRVVQFSLIALVLFMMYPIIKKMFLILFKKASWSETEFISVLLASLLVYMIFWHKWVWPWYMLWFFPLAIIANVINVSKYLKRAAIWIILSPIFFHVIWLINFKLTGGDANAQLWFYWYMVISIFAYPAYNLFKLRKIGYKNEENII